ncbi:MAG: HAD family hydrolase [Candidatus Hermodarchaeota archaeon]
MHSPIIVLFDLDGVILTQKALEYTALIYLKNKWYNWQNIENLRLIDFARYFEEADSENRLKALREVNKMYKSFIPNIIKRQLFFIRFRQSYRKYEKIYEKLNPQIKFISAKFKKNGIVSGIVSNTSRERLNFYKNKFQLDKYFSVFLSRDDTIFRKPHAYPIFLALKEIKKSSKLPIDLKKVYYVGDLPTDIMCAKNANVNSIALLSGHGTTDQLKDSKPDFILETLEDLLKIEPLKKLLLN